MRDTRLRHFSDFGYGPKKEPLGYGHRSPPKRLDPRGNHVLSDFKSGADRQAEALIADQLYEGFKKTLDTRGSLTVEDGYAFISGDDWVAFDVPRIANRVLRAFTGDAGLVRVGMAQATREGRHASLITVWGRPE